MKRWMLLLLSCVVLGCSSPFVSIDPEAYRAETVSAAPVEPTAAPGPDAPVSDAPEPTLRPLLREAYAIPETVQFDELEGHMTLTGTAVVEVPDVSVLPRATAKRAAFDQDTVDALYRACFPSGGTFDYSELNGGYSKAELDAMLGVLTRYEAMSRVKSVRYFCETERKRLLALYDDALDAIPREATKPQLTDGKVTLMSAPMWNLGNVVVPERAICAGMVPRFLQAQRGGRADHVGIPVRLVSCDAVAPRLFGGGGNRGGVDARTARLRRGGYRDPANLLGPADRAD